MIFNENILGNKLLNSSYGIFHNYPFNIIEEFGSTVPLFRVSVGLMSSSTELTGSCPTMTKGIDTSNYLIENHLLESL